MNIPLNIDFQQILLHLLNFAILGGGLYLLLYKPVKQFMEKREAYYRQEHDDAQADKLVADAHVAAQREHDKLLAQSQKEIQELAMTATEKLLLTKQGGDPYDQFLDKAEEEQHG